MRRPDEQLPFFMDEQAGGPALLLDTCVYIDRLQGRAPKVLDDLIATRQTHHSTVAIQELMHTVGVLPDDRRTATAISAIGRLINAMRPHRVFSPDADVLGRAAFLSGVLCRVQGSSKDTRLRSLQDCTLYLQAQKLGLTILTANVGDFDALMQMTNTHGVLFYRTV